MRRSGATANGATFAPSARRATSACSGSSTTASTTPLDWLISLGAEPVWQETGNPRTVGKRFDPRALAETLGAHAGRIELGADGSAADEPTILCTGGFGASPSS